MSREANKAIARRWFNAWYLGDPAVIDELVAPDFTRAGRALGPEGARQVFQGLHNAWSDSTFTIEEMLAEDDKVMVRFTGASTQSGAINHPVFGHIPASGTRAPHAGVNIYRIVDGKVAEETTQHDGLGIFLALGAIQPAAKT